MSAYRAWTLLAALFAHGAAVDLSSILPVVPSIPTIPRVSSLASTATAAIPGLASLSGLAAISGLPAVNGIPLVPGLAAIESAVTGSIPAIPGIPAIPSSPAELTALFGNVTDSILNFKVDKAEYAVSIQKAGIEVLSSLDKALFNNFVSSPINVSLAVKSQLEAAASTITDHLFDEFFAIQNQTVSAKVAVLAALVKLSKPFDVIPYANITALLSKISTLDNIVETVIADAGRITLGAKSAGLQAVQHLDAAILPAILSAVNLGHISKFGALNALVNVESEILSALFAGDRAASAIGVQAAAGLWNTTKGYAAGAWNVSAAQLNVFKNFSVSTNVSRYFESYWNEANRIAGNWNASKEWVRIFNVTSVTPVSTITLFEQKIEALLGPVIMFIPASFLRTIKQQLAPLAVLVPGVPSFPLTLPLPFGLPTLPTSVAVPKIPTLPIPGLVIPGIPGVAEVQGAVSGVFSPLAGIVDVNKNILVNVSGTTDVINSVVSQAENGKTQILSSVQNIIPTLPSGIALPAFH